MTNSTPAITPPPEEGSEQTLLQHLNELRIRLTWVVGGVLLFTIVSFVFAQDMLLFLMEPFIDVFGTDAGLQALTPTEGIETYFKVSMLSGAILSMPFTIYQLWLFISPGLTKSERRYVFVFVPSVVLLFLIGLAFSWFILLPAAVTFLATFLSDVFNPDWQGQEYISFVFRMLFWISVSFQMPIIIYFLARFGLVTPKVLREQWRFAVVGIAILAAVITPSIDPVTMLLTMAPLNVLYLLSILLARVGYRQFERSVEIE